MDGSFFARGSQSVSAAFAELVAPVFDSLEIDAAGRVDHYNTSAGTAFTPKVGFKWTVIPQFALRGTYARVSARPASRKAATPAQHRASHRRLWIRCAAR